MTIVRKCKYNRPEYLSNFQRNCNVSIKIIHLYITSRYETNAQYKRATEGISLLRVTIQCTLDDEWSIFKTLGQKDAKYDMEIESRQIEIIAGSNQESLAKRSLRHTQRHTRLKIIYVRQISTINNSPWEFHVSNNLVVPLQPKSEAGNGYISYPALLFVLGTLVLKYKKYVGFV